ncbi:class I SAM-dependent methyltransferase [Bradyrhizobium sp. CCBAU 53380]|uniref:class I SAM-dependent methyltransferase n=1 Tax=Bradyrhizobium sp. CCBAU 53380 TaxID=1325117 RepID=UPI002302590B|nr:class I SAM-dependent methyltransferase [Bradyrhizobium sp. CCBAU 53380]
MMESLPSRTALATSLMRALHSRFDPFPLLNDPWGDRLVSEAERERMTARILARMDEDMRARALRTPASVLDEFLLTNTALPGVVIRSRYAEDALREAATRGTKQYVLIGAGLDSFVLRRPAFSDSLTIFEIDHPATQTMKIQRIKECGMSLPPSVHFVAADLANEDLVSVLDRSRFRPGEKAFFSWLGVSVYLTRQANLATLRAVATCSARGSELVFTYVDQAEFAPNTSQSPDDENAKVVAQIGEPWISGFNPDEIVDDLARVGLNLVEDLDGKAMWERYRGANTTLGHPPATLHIALARVGK